MLPEYIFFSGLIISVAFIIYLLLDYSLCVAERHRKEFVTKQNRVKILNSLPEAVRRAKEPIKEHGRLSKWNENISRQINRTGWRRVNVQIFNGACVSLSFVGMLAGLYLFRDISIAITITMLLGSIPFMVMSWANFKYDQRLLSQLPLAIQVFATEFSITKKLRDSLERVANNTTSPLKEYIEQCVHDLTSNRYVGESLKTLADNLKFPYGRFWAQIMYAATENEVVVKLMPRLITRLGWQRLLIQQNITNLSGMRRVGIILNILIIPGYFLVHFAFPDTIDFYSTIIGKIVIILVFLSISGFIVFDQWLQRVEI